MIRTTASRLTVLAVGLALFAFAATDAARAQSPGDGRPRPDPGIPTSPNVSVSTGPNGVTIHIAVDQTVPGISGARGSSARRFAPAPSLRVQQDA